MDQDRKAFVERLAEQNHAFYGTPDGLGTLRAFELTFEHRWIYLFELVQNALDAGARSISIHVTDDGLVFQHDGDAPLLEANVEGLSKIFRSTKGAATVGFMGIGFKSVFGRFRKVHVSGWGWTFRYDVSQVVGETYGDVQPDLLGAVLPIWDESIASPDPGFTTRFGLARLVDPDVALASDLTYFLSQSDRTPLAILAASGLTRLEVSHDVWELGVRTEPDGSVEATAISTGENLRWQLFPTVFKPSPAAVARFLEHRRIQPTAAERERVHAEAARARRLIGVLPLDSQGNPNPPKRGRVYATLPTEVTVPFGIHVNADWLPNISRTGLRDVEDNAWQREIADCVADMLSSFLGWVARSCRQQAKARAAYGALALPSAGGHGQLEPVLANTTWLSRLKTHLEHARVLPEWTKPGTEVSFAMPTEILLPPKPLADAFIEQPELDPPSLLKGHVLDSQLLGPGGLDLFKALGLLQDMTPSAIAAAWADGLEAWWRRLPADDSNRRDLLFRLWGAVAELEQKPGWAAVRLPCVRTVSGQWLTVAEVKFFNEALPSDREPGGTETRALIESFLPDFSSCLPDTWMGALRQSAGNESGLAPFTRARVWLEWRAKAIDLRTVMSTAIAELAKAPQPDWTRLLHLGRWALHRNRPDLLTHVLVESAAGAVGAPVSRALIADPYVERGENRRRLHHDRSAVSAVYAQSYTTEVSAHGWRSLFEKAGASGNLEIRSVERRVSTRNSVADFIGVPVADVSTANASGYTVIDFQIQPGLPEVASSSDTRSALAPWLEDGFSALNGKGRRKASYFYYSPYAITGTTSSDWVRRLRDLEWVPCRDGTLRRPAAALAQSDASREDAPVAGLSEGLVAALRGEGIHFGADVPQAPSLRRLVKLGPTLSAEAMAALIREVREQCRDDNEARLFADAAQTLSLPLNDGRRIPINRVVQKVGGRLRGTLGGWIAPMNDVPDVLREELLRPSWPYAFPQTTTGAQALHYIQDVWSRARSASEGLANEVRDILPTAYTYVLEDVAVGDDISHRWNRARSDAVVFAGREWIVLSSSTEPVYVDDIEDRRFFPTDVRLRTATAGHLGNSPEQQRATAEALGLRPLSSVIELNWREVGDDPIAEWTPRFTLISSLLGNVRRRDESESSRESIELHARHLERLELTVRLADSEPRRVHVNARFSRNVLTVAGRPIAFASDAAKELLRGFSFRQRGDLAADLTGLLAAIDSAEDFAAAVDKFVASHLPGFEIPSEFRPPERQVEPAEAVDEPRPDPPPDVQPTVPLHNVPATPAAPTPPPAPPPQGGSFDRDRALAAQKALAEKLRKALKGELEPDWDSPDEAGSVATEQGGGELGDERYREIALKYERECGREPVAGDPRQKGWDIESLDPKTGIRRLIEVKGKGYAWSRNEVVELTRAQVRRAFQAINDGSTTEWYLYVVEQQKAGVFEVLPIQNPVQLAGKWLLRGADWRMVSKDPRQVTFDVDLQGSPVESQEE